MPPPRSPPGRPPEDGAARDPERPGDHGGTQPQTGFGSPKKTAKQTSPGGQRPVPQTVSIWQPWVQAEPVPEAHVDVPTTQRHPVLAPTLTAWQTLPDGQFPPHVG